MRRNNRYLLLSLFVATLIFFGNWYFYSRVLNPLQHENWAREHRPVLNRSDFYQRWYGAREFLLHGRNPYSDEITAEIQMRFYGRRLDPNRPGEWRDQQRFAYPLYVVVYLAPLVKVPFDTLTPFFVVFLLLSSMAAVFAWFVAMGIKPKPIVFALALLLYFGNGQAMEAIYLNQVSLVIAALIAGAVAAYVKGRYGLSGVMLGLAMIKPQLVIPVAGWLGICALSRWNKRKSFIAGYTGVLGLLLLSAQLMMPGWFWQWRDSARAYLQYADVNIPVLTMMLGKNLGTACTVAIGIAAFWICWRLRKADTDSPEFKAMVALVACCTVALPPVWHTYDHVLLFPVVVLTIRALEQARGEQRIILVALSTMFATSWIAGPILVVLHWLNLVSTSVIMALVPYPWVLTPIACIATVFILARFYTGQRIETSEGRRASAF